MSLQEFLLLSINETIQISIRESISDPKSIDITFIDLKAKDRLVRTETISITAEYMESFSMSGIINRAVQRLKK